MRTMWCWAESYVNKRSRVRSNLERRSLLPRKIYYYYIQKINTKVRDVAQDTLFFDNFFDSSPLTSWGTIYTNPILQQPNNYTNYPFHVASKQFRIFFDGRLREINLVFASTRRVYTIRSIYDKVPLRTCSHNTIDIVKIVVPKRLIRSPLLLICLECTFKLGQILRKIKCVNIESSKKHRSV